MIKNHFAFVFGVIVCGAWTGLVGCAGSGPKTSSDSVAPSVLSNTDPYFADVLNNRVRPVVGTGGMVVSDDRVASEWGAEILRRGGNAIDAAVATGFALSVTRPHYASLGGGGFMVYCPRPQNGASMPCHVIDFRERAPRLASRDMYIKDGVAQTKLSQMGALAVGVPGVVSGLLTASERYGSRPRQEMMWKAIQLAEEGVRMSGVMERRAISKWASFNSEARRVLSCGHEASPCRPGERLKQPDLALVLRAISASGPSGFYSGWVKDRIVNEVRAAGGIIVGEDFSRAEAVSRPALSGQFAGFEVVTMPPPSSGGIALLQILGYAERADQAGAFERGLYSAQGIHALAHGMSLAFADRATHLGDPDAVRVPVRDLLAQTTLDARWRETYRRGSANIPKEPSRFESVREPMHTTHYSVIDQWGGAVSVTTSVNSNYGSGFVPQGTGVFLNNTMDDFSIQPGVPNTYGLVGSTANAIEPGKTPLSSMTPTIVRDLTGMPRIVIGASDGPRIITSVALTLLQRLRFGRTLPDAMAAPRFHHQWKPETIIVEKGVFGSETLDALKDMGWKLDDDVTLGVQTAIERFPDGRVWGVPDMRMEGAAVAAE